MASVIKIAKQLQRCTCMQAGPTISRSLATPAGFSTVNEKIRSKQELFQLDDGKPVHIKGGVIDSILYKFTMGCCALSLVLMATTFIKMAMPKKQ